MKIAKVTKLLFALSLFPLLIFYPSIPTLAKLKVVTTLPDLADLAKAVGGDKVEVTSLMRGNQDPHYVEPRPSQVIDLRRADAFIKVGLALDIWADALVDKSGNDKIMYGGSGYVDTCVKIRRLQVPKEKVDPSKGHLHPLGNPHYWLDPDNAKVITQNILEGLSRVSPKDAEYFKKNREEFLEKLNQKIQSWEKKMAPYKGTKIVTFHNSWIYFASHFGLNIVGTIEPKPGIPPSPTHTAWLIEKMKEENVKLIIVETYFSLKVPQFIAQRTGAKVIVLPTSIGGIKGVDTYLELFDYNVNKIVEALSG